MPRKYEDYFKKIEINGVEVTVFNDEWFLLRDVAPAVGYTFCGLRDALELSYGKDSGHIVKDTPPPGSSGLNSWVHVSALRTGPLQGRKQTARYVKAMKLLVAALAGWPYVSVPKALSLDKANLRVSAALSSIGSSRLKATQALGLSDGSLSTRRILAFKVAVVESYVREVLVEREAKTRSETAKQTQSKNPFKSKMRSLRWTNKTTARNLGLSLEEVERYCGGKSIAPKYVFTLFGGHETGTPQNPARAGWRKDTFLKAIRQGAHFDAAMLAVGADSQLLTRWRNADPGFDRALLDAWAGDSSAEESNAPHHKGTPERKAAVIEALKGGSSMDTAASAAKVCRSTLHNWRKEDSDFDKQVRNVWRHQNTQALGRKTKAHADNIKRSMVATITSERWNLNGTPMQVSLKETRKDGVLTFSVTEHQPGMTVEHYSGPSPERAREAYERTAKAVGDFWAESMTLGM